MAALAALVTLLSTEHSRAQGAERVELTWRAPAGCPSAAAVRARVRKLVGSPRANGSRVRADATVTRSDEGRFHLRLIVRTRGVSGERHIEARSCEDLAGAAAVNVVLLLGYSTAPASQPGTRAGESESTVPSLPAAPASASSSSSLQPEATTHRALDAQESAPPASQEGTRVESAEHSAPEAWRPLLRLSVASLSIGPVPRPSLGFALGAGVRLDRWSFLAEVAAWLRQTLPVSGRAGVGAEVDHIDAGLRSCYAFGWQGFELAPCVSVSLRHVWLRGSGAFIVARSAESTWVAAGVGAQTRLSLSEGLSLIAGLGVQLETSRPRIWIDGVGEVDQLAPASVTFAAGIEWAL